MTKYEWTKKQIYEATKDYPPENRRYLDAFLEEVKKAGESLTRTKYLELFEQGRPPLDADTDYFEYDVLDDRFALVANFSEAWQIPEVEPLPRITTTSKCGKVKLPDDFCTLGGTPDWIQNERFPICPQCDADMILFLQLKSLPYELTKKREDLAAFTFGDAGNFYLFQCPACDTYKTSSECY